MNKWEKSAEKTRRKFIRMSCHGNYATCPECPTEAKSEHWVEPQGAE